MQNRKETAWRKNKKFGRVYGGRSHPKLADGIFRRLHSIRPPNASEPIPILIQDNPSREFFFPLNKQEVLTALEALPRKAMENITHVWLRRVRKSDVVSGNHPLAEFVCGSGVRAIILYPWRIDKLLCVGRRRPKGAIVRSYEPYAGQAVQKGAWWYYEFTDEGLRRFYIQYLLYHEVGHHIDWYRRHWTSANRKQTEEAANQYAVHWSKTAKHVFNFL